MGTLGPSGPQPSTLSEALFKLKAFPSTFHLRINLETKVGKLCNEKFSGCSPNRGKFVVVRISLYLRSHFNIYVNFHNFCTLFFHVL